MTKHNSPITGREIRDNLEQDGLTVEKVGAYFYVEDDKNQRVYFPNGRSPLAKPARESILSKLAKLGFLVLAVLLALTVLV